jgi:hypothetical protein
MMVPGGTSAARDQMWLVFATKRPKTATERPKTAAKMAGFGHFGGYELLVSNEFSRLGVWSSLAPSCNDLFPSSAGA